MDYALGRKLASPPSALLKIVLLALLLLFSFPLMTSLAEERGTPEVSPIVQQELLLLDRINGIRAEYGLHPLVLNDQLTQAAHAHVAEAVSRHYMSHTGADGSSYYDRVARTGYAAAKVNEAIGWGYNMDRQLNWWLNSRVHRGMLLSPLYTEIGIGYQGNPTQQWGHWWVLNFALPAE